MSSHLLLSRMLLPAFFNRDPQIVAKALLGKVLRRFYQKIWLNSMIIETEAYYIHDKASHSSLGYTEKRKALFMPAGTIYMYYARGGDSLNISCKGAGNAVLVKSAVPYLSPDFNLAPDLNLYTDADFGFNLKSNNRFLGTDKLDKNTIDFKRNEKMILLMQKLNPPKNLDKNNNSSSSFNLRAVHKLCSGQTLLCKSLNLKVPDWNQKTFHPKIFRIDDVGYKPKNIIQTRRLGIPMGRDEHLLYRFISGEHVKFCTKIPKI